MSEAPCSTWSRVDFEVNDRSRKRVVSMTDEEKTRALLVDELTGLGNRRAWEEGVRLPVQVMLDVEGLKWVNDNLGWGAGDELLKIVAAAIGAEGLRGYRLGGDEFVCECENGIAAQGALDRIRRRLRSAEIIGVVPVGAPRRLRGPRIHAGMGRSLAEAHAELNSAKRAGVAAGECARRGERPRGMKDADLVSVRKRKGAQLRFYLQAFREADPDFRKEKTEDDQLSRAWLIRRTRCVP
jgi:GGDEF domain-containing protein